VRTTFTFLSVLLCIASIASLVQRTFEVGLAPVTEEILTYYRWFAVNVLRTYFFDWWSIRWLGIVFPDWFLDVISVYAVQVSSFVRSLTVEWDRGKIWVRRYPIYFLAGFVPLTGFIVPVVSLVVENRRMKDLRIWTAYLSVFAGVAAFFAWNTIQVGL